MGRSMEGTQDDSQNIPGLSLSLQPYGSDPRQTVAVWQPEAASVVATGYWVIFIHGGAWVSQNNKATDFAASIKHAVASGASKDHIRGFMGLDYRLSPRSADAPSAGDKPQVQHPDHILDVRAALRYLDKQYSIDNNYVLVGHSAGATLAFQVLMGDAALRSKTDEPAPKPAAVVGISGIYDMVNLNRRFKGNYSYFLDSAFTADEQVWVEASPAQYRGSYAGSAIHKRPIVLATSPEDTLIDMPEMESMVQKLEADGLTPDVVRDLHGEHDDIWTEGSQIAALIFRTLTKLVQKK